MRKNLLFCLIICICALNIYAQTNRKESFCKCDTVRIIKDSVDLSLVTFSPILCNLELMATRPDSNDENVVFCAPAAFTAKNYREIVGRFVGSDTIIENPTEKETGLCVTDGQNVYIGSISDSLMYYHHALQNGDVGYFQQMLLIDNGNKVECTIFGKQKPTFRRALAIKNGQVCVVESLNRMNIGDFTDVMIDEGFSHAIYMDMGTWSEGFYVSQDGEKHIIGALRQNTRYQTNWLLFTAKRKK